jgi:hypothetical protein
MNSNKLNYKPADSTAPLPAELIDTLAKTAYCRPEIAALAEKLDPLTAEKANSLIAQLTEMGEDVALNRILNVCAYKDIDLDPKTLADSTLVIADITHMPFCFTNQNADAVPFILETAHSEELSWERKAMLARVAAEISVKYKTSSDDIKNFLLTLRQEVTTPHAGILISDTLNLLKSGKLEPDIFPIMIDNDIHADLPEKPPRNIIGGGETIRRPIPKLSRNEPCHCGSGKKYKRCCLEKDRKILADASSYAGITQTQLHDNPGIVDDSSIIDSLRSYEVKKLHPEKLTTNQLFPAFWRASHFGLTDIAFAMLVEYSKRTDGDFDLDPGHFSSIISDALEQDNLELAQQALDQIPDDYEYIDRDDIDMHFEMYRNPGLLEHLENRCRQALTHELDDDMFRSHDFCNLAHKFRHKFPALSIIFARTAVQEGPDRFLDNDLLVDNVHQTRIDIGLDFFGDPIDDAFDKAEEDYIKTEEAQAQSQKHQELQEQLKLARKRADATSRKLKQNETELRKTKHKLEKISVEHKDSASENEINSAIETIDKYKTTMTRLRRQVDNLKVEVGNQQDKHRKLRHELEKEKRHSQKINAGQPDIRKQKEAELKPPDENDRKMLIPDYSNDFKDSCRHMPSAITSAALKAITGFATYDKAVWKHARSIKKLNNIYRIRIGLHYRLLLHWLPGQNLTVLNIIPRQDLESWIKRQS